MKVECCKQQIIIARQDELNELCQAYISGQNTKENDGSMPIWEKELSTEAMMLKSGTDSNAKPVNDDDDDDSCQCLV